MAGRGVASRVEGTFRTAMRPRGAGWPSSHRARPDDGVAAGGLGRECTTRSVVAERGPAQPRASAPTLADLARGGARPRHPVRSRADCTARDACDALPGEQQAHLGRWSALECWSPACWSEHRTPCRMACLPCDQVRSPSRVRVTSGYVPHELRGLEKGSAADVTVKPMEPPAREVQQHSAFAAARLGCKEAILRGCPSENQEVRVTVRWTCIRKVGSFSLGSNHQYD